MSNPIIIFMVVMLVSSGFGHPLIYSGPDMELQPPSGNQEAANVNPESESVQLPPKNPEVPSIPSIPGEVEEIQPPNQPSLPIGLPQEDSSSSSSEEETFVVSSSSSSSSEEDDLRVPNKSK